MSLHQHSQSSSLLLRSCTLSLLILFLLTSCTSTPTKGEAESLRTQAFIEELVTENTALREELSELRERTQLCTAYAATENKSLNTCLDNLALFSEQREIPNPHARITPKDIHVYESQVVITVPGLMPVNLLDTNSMDPLADESSKILVATPASEGEVHVGDIIGYHCSTCAEDEVIMHRVIGINQDLKGLYYTLQGDNNPSPDPDKVRFDQVETVVVGIIY